MLSYLFYSIISKKFRQAFVEHTCIGRLVSADRKKLKRANTGSSTISAANNSKYITTKPESLAMLGSSAPPAEDV